MMQTTQKIANGWGPSAKRPRDDNNSHTNNDNSESDSSLKRSLLERELLLINSAARDALEKRARLAVRAACHRRQLRARRRRRRRRRNRPHRLRRGLHRPRLRHQNLVRERLDGLRVRGNETSDPVPWREFLPAAICDFPELGAHRRRQRGPGRAPTPPTLLLDAGASPRI